ncbi:hypothetical protein JCM3766R1_003221 [Sporobolomyces carnicolor]
MVFGMNPPPPVPPKLSTFEYAAVPIAPSSPTPSSPRTASFHSTIHHASSLHQSQHFRKRSSFDITFDDPDVASMIQLDRDHAPSRYGRVLSEKPSSENEPLSLVGSAAAAGRGKGYMSWRDARATGRRAGVKRCIALVALFVVCVLGWLGGLATSDASTKAKGKKLAKASHKSTSRCNPYEQHGVLNVNLSDPGANAWRPFTASPACQPVDYMNLLHKATVKNDVADAIKFVENRTIVLYGDSIDRDHNEHMCQFLQGWHEMIGSDHALSPPYPPGEELPPPGYASFMNGKREWPSWLQSRPWICHVPKLNFRIVNVFHYGFQEADFDNGYITTHPHFYPPASVEERFSQIIVPLMEGLSERHNISAVPDILSIAPGFWSQLRQSVADQTAQKAAVEQGTLSLEEAEAKFDPWRSMTEGEKKWFEGRTFEILRHCARGWRGGRDVRGKKFRPTLLWRAPHPIKETNTVPFTRTVAVDQIGRSVVSHLIEESNAAKVDASTWRAWSKQIGAKALGWTAKGRRSAASAKSETAAEEDFANRLRIDEWGPHMIGQTRYFRDEVHPLALPGSWLYGNMLLHQLRMTVDEER